jgi:hypothetical protein
MRYILLALFLTGCSDVPNYVHGICSTQTINYGDSYDECIQNYKKGKIS